MKLSRKLIPAMIMLLVSAVLMSTASFAWFSTNTEATATGFHVQVAAANTLLIREGTTNAFTTSIEITDETKLSMMPVSADKVAAPEFWMVDPMDQENGIEPGSAAYDDAKTKFIEDEDLANVLHKTLQIRAQGDNISDAIGLGKATVTVTITQTQAHELNKSFRILLVVSGDNLEATPYLFAPTGATPVQAVVGYDESAEGTDEDPKVLLAENVGAFASAATIDFVPVLLSEEVYTVQVYMWFEGQDPACFANNATALEDIDVAIQFNLVAGAAQGGGSGNP